MYGVALLASALLSVAAARLYERCELARDLLQLGVRRDHVATWVCIAYHESRFDTAARNPSSGDHGLLQISQIYWCGAGKACGLPCSALRDDDISDDVQCALTIYEEHTRLQGNGFLAWVVYPTYCKHNPKKYLADCDLSLKDGSYSTEERGRSSNVYDPYPTINQTLSNSVQSASYPQSDRPLPGYLAIAALLRGKFESDFERDYNNRYKVNKAQPRITYVDDRKYDLSSFTTKKPKTTTTTTTSEPELYYPPVKPWRVIETNQFRRRKMKFEAPIEKDMVITNFINTFVRTTPTPTVNSFTTDKPPTITSALNSSSVSGTFRNALKTLSTVTDRPLTSPSTFSTKISPQNAYAPTSTQSFLTNSNSPKKETTIKSERTSPTPYWYAYTRPWTTPLPKLVPITPSPKPVETFTTNKNVIKHIEHEYKSPSLTPIAATTNKPTKSIDKGDNEKNNLSQSKTITFGAARNTSSAVDVTTMKTTTTTTIPTRGPTRGWTLRPSLFNQFYSQNKSSGYQFGTENPQTSWRRGKSQPNPFQESSPFGVNRYYTTIPSTTPRSLISSTSQFFNRSNLSDTAQKSSTVTILSTRPTPAVTQATSTPDPKTVVDATLSQKTTEKPPEKPSTLPTPKTTLSIFDLYLNPNRKTQLPNYSSLFSNKSPSNFKIFSGGTTASPFIGRR